MIILLYSDEALLVALYPGLPITLFNLNAYIGMGRTKGTIFITFEDTLQVLEIEESIL